MSIASKLDLSLLLEEKHSLLGIWPESHLSGAEVWLSEVRDCNARMAEAIAMSDKSCGSLSQARAHLFRGSLDEAGSTVDTALEMPLLSKERAELLIEKARLAQARGAWEMALEIIDAALAEDVAAISRMTLMQMRSLSCYELGDFSSAAKDISKAESMLDLFPFSSTRPYIWSIKARILARTVGLERGFDFIHQAWRTLHRENSLTPDAASALLRADIDLKRLSGSSYLDLAVGSYLLEKQMGEDLYVGLALLDCFHAGEEAVQDFFRNELEESARRFEKVRILWDEIQQKTKTRTTTAAAFEHTKKEILSKGDLSRRLGSRFLFVQEADLLIHLEDWKILNLETFPRLSQALRALQGRDLSKQDFFMRVWGISKFSDRLHANLISVLGYRFKKELGTHVLSIGKTIKFNGLYV